MDSAALKLDLNNEEDKACHLTLVQEEYDDATEGFFAPVSADLVDFLMTQHSTDKKRITELASLMGSSDVATALHFFIHGNVKDERYGVPRGIEKLFDPVGAVAQLTADYWAKALSLTDVYDHMPQARRDEWDDQIRNPLGRAATSSTKEILPLPEFEENSVRATLQDLLNNRARYFSERVDGIFKGLSRSHVTNQPEGFRRRMIINGAIENGSIDSSTAGLVNDLRTVIARFMGRDEPKWGVTYQTFEIVRQKNGVWREVDGGALRVRIYNGVGTAHIEVHEDVAWRLNAILASIYPMAIPHKYRKRPVRTKKTKEFKLFDKPLPFAVIDCLANLKQGFEVIKNGHRTSRKYLPNTLESISLFSTDKAVRAQTEDVLQAIGGVFDGKFWCFDYEPDEVISEIVCTGMIPDRQSHQFYSSPELLAREVVSKASEGALPGMDWLEPQAGQGDLADYVPEDANLLCCEISELHCQILQAKGFDKDNCSSSRTVKCVDFLAFAAHYTGEGFDRIICNPPYNQGRWQAHLEASIKLLKSDGRLVAILPASANNKELIPGFKHSYSRVFENKFAGTSISVVILTLGA